ncbi:MAG: hypothetical protein U0V70_05825 [Terriglobia bacterium]
MTASIKSTPNSIGYIEYGYARSQNVPMAMPENKSGIRDGHAESDKPFAFMQLPENLDCLGI